MARRKLSETSHPDESLDENYWLKYGSDPQPSMRVKILFVTFDEIAEAGPGSFNVSSVCDRLGITYPMVNHYFGGRDSLIAEAAHMVYARYVERLWTAVQAAPRDPRERLKAWILAQIKETHDMGGWGAVLNYPLAAKEVSAEISANFGKEMARGFELNMARLGMLILDIRRGKVSDSDFAHGRVPRSQLLADPELQALLPVVGWGVIGASVWLAGRHLPATGVIEELESFDLNGSVDSLVTGLIRLVETHH
jgi:AcrR family transcriptional regulator